MTRTRKRIVIVLLMMALALSLVVGHTDGCTSFATAAEAASVVEQGGTFETDLFSVTLPDGWSTEGKKSGLLAFDALLKYQKVKTCCSSWRSCPQSVMLRLTAISPLFRF